MPDISYFIISTVSGITFFLIGVLSGYSHAKMEGLKEFYRGFISGFRFAEGDPLPPEILINHPNQEKD